MTSRKTRMSSKKQNRCIRIIAEMNRRKRELTPKETELIKRFLDFKLNTQDETIKKIARETGRAWNTIRKLVEDVGVNYTNVIDLGPKTTAANLIKALRHMNLRRHRLTPRTLKRIKKLLIELHVRQDLWITEIARQNHVNEALLRGLMKKTLGTTKITIDMKGNETTQKVLQIISKLNLERHTLTPRARRTIRRKLRQLHLKQGISVRRIARMTGKSKTGSLRLLRRLRVPVRDKIQATLSAKRKGPKLPFEGNEEEEAQMVGLRLGDIHTRRCNRLIAVAVTTTHPAMIKLFIDTFSRYASIYKRAYYDRHTHLYKYRLWASLHPSFRFLLNGRENVSRYLKAGPKSFLRLLAGFTDTDGSIKISHHGRKSVSIAVRWGNTDKQLLDAIRAQLKKMGFNPCMCISKRRGYKTSYGITRKDFWELAIYRKQEVRRLLQILPVMHAEKIARKRLALKILDQHLTWLDVEKDVMTLRHRTRDQVTECKMKAQREQKERTLRNR